MRKDQHTIDRLIEWQTRAADARVPVEFTLACPLTKAPLDPDGTPVSYAVRFNPIDYARHVRAGKPLGIIPKSLGVVVIDCDEGDPQVMVDWLDDRDIAYFPVPSRTEGRLHLYCKADADSLRGFNRATAIEFTDGNGKAIKVDALYDGGHCIVWTPQALLDPQFSPGKRAVTRDTLAELGIAVKAPVTAQNGARREFEATDADIQLAAAIYARVTDASPSARLTRDGQWYGKMTCPRPDHPDQHPSASLFVDSGGVNCFVCGWLSPRQHAELLGIPVPTQLPAQVPTLKEEPTLVDFPALPKQYRKQAIYSSKPAEVYLMEQIPHLIRTNQIPRSPTVKQIVQHVNLHPATIYRTLNYANNLIGNLEYFYEGDRAKRLTLHKLNKLEYMLTRRFETVLRLEWRKNGYIPWHIEDIDDYADHHIQALVIKHYENNKYKNARFKREMQHWALDGTYDFSDISHAKSPQEMLRIWVTRQLSCTSSRDLFLTEQTRLTGIKQSNLNYARTAASIFAVPNSVVVYTRNGRWDAYDIAKRNNPHLRFPEYHNRKKQTLHGVIPCASPDFYKVMAASTITQNAELAAKLAADRQDTSTLKANTPAKPANKPAIKQRAKSAVDDAKYALPSHSTAPARYHLYQQSVYNPQRAYIDILTEMPETKQGFKIVSGKLHSAAGRAIQLDDNLKTLREYVNEWLTQSENGATQPADSQNFANVNEHSRWANPANGLAGKPVMQRPGSYKKGENPQIDAIPF